MVLRDDGDLQTFISDEDASIVGELVLCHGEKWAEQLRHISPTLTVLSFAGFFADEKSTAQAEFVKAASALRDKYRFAHTNSEAVLRSQGVDGE